MIRIISVALAISVFSGTTAEAAICLPSAADVRKQQPRAWPKWTYGPQGERCWYAGKKPVFAKPNKEVRQAKAQSQQRAAPSAEPTSTRPSSTAPLQSDGGNKNIPQSWDLEYRWPK
jgi:hypothetical protein